MAREKNIILATTHCTIVAVDIEGFGKYSRNDTNRLRIRHGLYGAMRYTFETTGVPWGSCDRADTGDGVLILVPADVPKSLFADLLPNVLADALVRHNRSHPIEEKIRLRLALHAGEINYDDHGATSSSITHAFRLLDADVFRCALAESSGVLAVISSAWFFDEVIRHSERSDAAAYRLTGVTNKETITQAWIRLPGDRRVTLPRQVRGGLRPRRRSRD